MILGDIPIKDRRKPLGHSAHIQFNEDRCMPGSPPMGRPRSPRYLVIMLLIPWIAAFGCGYEFELAEDERRTVMPTDTTEDESEIDTSSGNSNDRPTDISQDNPSETGDQVSSTSNSTENENNDDSTISTQNENGDEPTISTQDESDDTHSTGPELPVCPEEIEFLPQAVILTDLASGKNAGTQFLDTCPKGQVIVGFHGFLRDFTTALVHGKLQGICASLSLRSVKNQCILETHTEGALPLRGLKGDIEWTRTCPDNEIVVGFGAKTGVDIDQLTFFCAPLVIRSEGDTYSSERGSINKLPLVGGSGGGTVIGLISCPDDTVASGTNIYSDTLVTGFGLKCQRLALY